MTRYISTLLLALTLSLPAYALNLNQAMSALGDAKASGQLGEQPNGYLGVVKPGGQADEIEMIVGRQAMAFRARGDGVQVAQPLARPYRPPAVQLVEGAHVRLLITRQAADLVAEAVVEGGGLRGALHIDLLRTRRGAEGQRRRCDAQAQLPSVHDSSAS